MKKESESEKGTANRSPVNPLLFQVAPQAPQVPLVTLKLSRNLIRVLPNLDINFRMFGK